MLAVVAFAPNLRVLVAASFGLGLLCITPQLVVTYSANLAAPGERGQIVGTVMSGLLIGILASRTLSGWLSAHSAGGWRVVYLSAGGMMILLTLALARFLPRQPPVRSIGYGELMGSLATLLRKEPVLRRHMLIGAFGFGSFSAFWTTLGFHLQALPGHYGSETVGLYGLFGVAGALAAPISGRLSDRVDARWVNGGALVLISASFVLMALGGGSLVALAVGVVLMDAGVQGSHLFEPDPDLRAEPGATQPLERPVHGRLFSRRRGGFGAGHLWLGERRLVRRVRRRGGVSPRGRCRAVFDPSCPNAKAGSRSPLRRSRSGCLTDGLGRKVIPAPSGPAPRSGCPSCCARAATPSALSPPSRSSQSPRRRP